MRDPRTFKRPATYNKPQDDFNRDIVESLAEIKKELEKQGQALRNISKKG